MPADPASKIYNTIARRKGEANDTGPYTGGNGRIDRAVDLILNEGFPRVGTLVDVGGATGNLGYALRGYFSRRVVMEISDECRRPAEEKGNEFYCLNVDVDGLSPLQDETVDLVVALDLIEHILDPGRFAAECFRVLRPGGRVLINTPNIQFWQHLHSLVVLGQFPHTSGDREVYHGGHVAFFTLDDMLRIFNDFEDPQHHLRGLTPVACPPIWERLLEVPDDPLLKRQRLCYPDLVFSCRK